MAMAAFLVFCSSCFCLREWSADNPDIRWRNDVTMERPKRQTDVPVRQLVRRASSFVRTRGTVSSCFTNHVDYSRKKLLGWRHVTLVKNGERQKAKSLPASYSVSLVLLPSSGSSLFLGAAFNRVSAVELVDRGNLDPMVLLDSVAVHWGTVGGPVAGTTGVLWGALLLGPLGR
eukprot:scaffold5119_cov33-Attheya_sp.AAC.1